MVHVLLLGRSHDMPRGVLVLNEDQPRAKGKKTSNLGFHEDDSQSQGGD